MGWFLVRQDTHGTRFDVARYASQEEANEAMAGFEAGYPHHQTYYVEHRYIAEMIEVVSALEAIRRRPEMYLGEGGARLTDLVFEALCLSDGGALWDRPPDQYQRDGTQCGDP